MAIGAKKNDILLQFLFEAVMISLVGRFIGALLGIGCTYFLVD
ncbi:MAG: FtsX-like permease family protein [Mucilaginibacter sp.]